jgi:hypothetical protein
MVFENSRIDARRKSMRDEKINFTNVVKNKNLFLNSLVFIKNIHLV